MYKKLYAFHIATEIRRVRAYSMLGVSTGSAGAGAMEGRRVLEICLCEWLKPPSSFYAGCCGAVCMKRHFSHRDLGSVTAERCFLEYSRGLLDTSSIQCGGINQSCLQGDHYLL